jgi:LacI family transcriptional regulator, repressor for deo operon, udp, cdd, tsx, nupC, and nupG
MDRKIATIQDVARIAGVSTATVSRTLSKPSVVAPATRDAVLQAVADTGYRINTQAANLRRQRTGSVIALVPNLANPFFSQIFAGMSAVLTEAGLGLLVADTQTGSDPEERLSYHLTSGNADGLILFDGTFSRDRLNVPGRPPVLLVSEWMEDDLPSVTVDNRHGAALAVGHLAQAGHSAIGFLSGPPDNVLTSERLAGFTTALADLGLVARPDWILEGDFSMDSGAAAARRWMALSDRPTALFCASDEMAIGFMGAVHRAGLSVPGDVSIVGFDNIEVAQHLTPGLTTIRQPRTIIGLRSAELLIDMIAANSLSGPSEVIEVELIKRASVAPPRTP